LWYWLVNLGKKKIGMVTDKREVVVKEPD